MSAHKLIPDTNDPGSSVPPEFKEAIDFTDQKHNLLSCPKCNHFIDGADIDIEKTIARCRNCNHIFAFAHDSLSGTVQFGDLIPEGIEILKLKSELEIRLDWRKTTSSGGRKFLVLFTFLWNILMLPFVLLVIFSGAWSILLMMSLHLTVGLGLLWYLSTIYLNKTLVSVTSRHIGIRTWPLRLPFFRSRELDSNSISQLYVSKYTQSTSNGVPNYAYALYALMKNGEKVSLIRGMTRESQRYIEQEVEKYLAIRDIAVPDESK